MAPRARIEVHDASLRAILSRAAEADLRARGRRVEADAKRRCPVDEGRLRNSIRSVYIASPSRPRVEVRAEANYARAVHDGTGIYGPRRAPIVPVRARVLRWEARGVSRKGGRTSRSLTGPYVYARSVRGVPGRPFLRLALPAAR